jgi:predicted ribosome quality control (RQC) complex YloA/Tae2 family protein
MTEIDKMITYNKRSAIIKDKLDQYLDDISIKQEVTNEDFMYHIELLHQAIENYDNVANEYKNIADELFAKQNMWGNALRLYAIKYGGYFMMKKVSPDGQPFGMDVNLNSHGEYVSVTINLMEEDEYVHKHNRRRTIYQKIRDGIIFFRQSFRES